MRLDEVVRPGLVDEGLSASDLSKMFENGIRAWNSGDVENQGALKDVLPLCESLDKELAARIAAYVDKKEPLGVEELPKLVESLRRRVNDRWRDADRIKG